MAMPQGWKLAKADENTLPNLQELKKMRFVFLHKVYLLSQGDRTVGIKYNDISSSTGIDWQFSYRIGQYLFDEGLITHGLKTMSKQKQTYDPGKTGNPWTWETEDVEVPIDWSPDENAIMITHEGILEVEQALSKPENPTEHFPAYAVNYTINIGGDMINSGIQQNSTNAIQKISEETSKKKENDVVRMLFVSANPKGTHPLELIRECNSIRDRIMFTEYGEQFDFDQRHEISVSEMDKLLLDYKPQILHFSGHGSSRGIIIFQDSNKEAEGTTIRALSDLFKIVNRDKTITADNKIKLVFLSACYSQKQAEAISKYVDCVVGMSTAVTDEAAIIFAESFYQALGYGKSVRTAFELGCNKVSRLNIPEEHTPKLSHRPEIVPSTIYLAKVC